MTLGTILALGAAALAGAGIVQAGLGLLAVQWFARRPRPGGGKMPAISVLKPLHGDEPLLEAALESFFVQDYPDFQLVFGVQSPTDPAIAVVRRLRQRYPRRDVALVIDGTRHGANYKISNVINMFPAATHDVLVLADSDVHAAADYLRRIVDALNLPGTGVATTLYAGRPAFGGMIGALGASYISHVFLPGALMARALRRQDCLGATMAVRRATLLSVGGFEALADHLADDAVLGQLVVGQGLAVRLAATVPTTTVPETTLSALYQHELRWARTIRSLFSLGHAASVVQYPIAWALLAVALSGGAWPALVLLASAWMARSLAAWAINQSLHLPSPASVWWMPLRDIMSVWVILASYRGGSVQWRGQVMDVKTLQPTPDFTPLPYRATEPAS